MIILLILAIMLFVVYIWILRRIDFEDLFTIGFLVSFLVILIEVSLLTPIIVVDKHPGMTIGTITRVKQNYFGSTSLYLQTSENNELEFCIEDENLVDFAKNMAGQKVRVGNGERVGIYPLSKCDQAPVIYIEKWEE